MDWKRLRIDGHPPCDGETVFVGVNEAGFCACFNQHGLMSQASGPVSVCFYDTAEGSHEVMTCLDFWAVLDVPTPFARLYGCIQDEVPNDQGKGQTPQAAVPLDPLVRHGD